jgi:uncharacterized membrane protein YidH (DUF202 family)
MAGEESRGLQSERTALAWVRSALSLMAVGAIAARQAAATVLAAVLLVLVLGVAAWMIVGAEKRHRLRTQDGGIGHGPPVLREAMLTGAVAVALSAVALLIVIA